MYINGMKFFCSHLHLVSCSEVIIGLCIVLLLIECRLMTLGGGLLPVSYNVNEDKTDVVVEVKEALNFVDFLYSFTLFLSFICGSLV